MIPDNSKVFAGLAVSEMGRVRKLVGEQRFPTFEAEMRSLYKQMARIAIALGWAKLLDFETRFPGTLKNRSRDQALANLTVNVDTREESIMDWKLEVVTVPVSDLDRAIDFYARKVGFGVDIDFKVSDEVRLVQMTPPGSACSIHLGTPEMGMEPGSISGVFLVVPDVLAARAELTEKGVEVSEVQVFDDGAYRQAREGESLDNVGCVFFSDPDGNRWCVQQIPTRKSEGG